jgi:hypothetical protein
MIYKELIEILKDLQEKTNKKELLVDRYIWLFSKGHNKKAQEIEERIKQIDKEIQEKEKEFIKKIIRNK